MNILSALAIWLLLTHLAFSNETVRWKSSVAQIKMVDGQTVIDMETEKDDSLKVSITISKMEKNGEEYFVYSHPFIKDVKATSTLNIPPGKYMLKIRNDLTDKVYVQKTIVFTDKSFRTYCLNPKDKQ